MKARDDRESILGAMEMSDLAGVLEIEKICFSRPWSRENFLLDLRSEDSCCLVARREGEVVGYIIGWFILDELHILNIAVHPQRQRRGIGQMLLRDLLARAERRGCQRATLELRWSNEAARRLYQKHGFRPIAIRKGYYRQPTENAMLMWMDFDSGSGEGPAGLEVGNGMVSKG